MVLAASYEAKAFGVHGGMPVGGRERFAPTWSSSAGTSRSTNGSATPRSAVLGDFTPLVERISIDEAFADVAGCTHLFGTPAEIAAAIRRRVRDELALPISVGVARTKHLAKIASQVAKPDGLVVVDPETELAFLHDLPVEMMWGVGPATRARLAERGIATIGDLAQSSQPRLPGFSAVPLARSWPPSPGTAILAPSGPMSAPARPERNRRSAEGPSRTGSSAGRSATLPTGSVPACGRRANPDGP